MSDPVIIQLGEYRIALDTDNGSVKISITGPEKSGCQQISDRLPILVTVTGFMERVVTYQKLQKSLMNDLSVPEIRDHPDALSDLTDWLRSNPKFIASVSDALNEYGFKPGQ